LNVRDVLNELAAARRAVGTSSLPAGDAYTIEIRRRYDAGIDDVWGALTDPDRVARWLAAVSGDLRLGGKFTLGSGEHGEILACDAPHLLKVTWMFGPEADAWPGTSEVQIRLTPGQNGDTEFELVHTAVLAEPLFPTYGPGAGGVGWDLHVLALSAFLYGGDTVDHDALRASSEGREFIRRSAAGWGAAHLASGGDADHVASAVEATTKFYAPDPA
jgi:uncharacterized protein YndB with AHSA1/START domain